ncbi:MAG: arylsulfatase [Cytophagales bacterium]|nr:arylsulfatase [Cytophagales bacterium]
MNIKKLLIFSSILLIIACNQGLKQETEVKKKNKPNILLIMADDMGYSDLGCYGGEINTPNLDKLANEGIRFTQFYNGARCCPTRATLMTGISPHLAGVGGMVNHQVAEEESPYQGYLNDNCVTIAEVLKPAGYRTYMTGKWHIGEFRPVYPVDRGFDKYYGLISGAMNYWNITKGKRKNVKRIFADDTTKINDQINNGFYATTAYTNKAIEYLDDHFENYSSDPFFMYIAHQAPHWPLHAPDSVIKKYVGKYKDGWEELRERRYSNMVNMGLVNEKLKLSPLDEATANWDDLTKEQKDTMDLKMAIYAAMVDVMDQNIGRVISRLEKAGQLNNTLVMFLSDNGASYEYGPFGRNFRPDLTDKMGSEDSYYSYGSSWANASNTPYQKFKIYTYEGGIATPFIARWGDKIKNKGGLTNALGHITDVMATAVELGGAEYPGKVGDQDIHPMEGKSLVSVLTGVKPDVRTDEDILVWEHDGNKAVRMGDWKIVKLRKDKSWKLFDLTNDRTERTDVSIENQRVRTELISNYEAWAALVGAVEKGVDDQ